MRCALAALVAGCLYACGCASPVGAQELPRAASPIPSVNAERTDEPYIVTDVYAPGDECRQNVRTVALSELIGAPAQFVGKCVRTTGVVAGWLIYVDTDAYHRGADWNHESGAPYRHIGTYPQVATAELGDEVVSADVIGIVDTCERLYGDSNVIMVLGYCHHFSGPFLRVARIERR